MYYANIAMILFWWWHILLWCTFLSDYSFCI